jgi:hypothetical protein
MVALRRPASFRVLAGSDSTVTGTGVCRSYACFEPGRDLHHRCLFHRQRCLPKHPICERPKSVRVDEGADVAHGVRVIESSHQPRAVRQSNLQRRHLRYPLALLVHCILTFKRSKRYYDTGSELLIATVCALDAPLLAAGAVDGAADGESGPPVPSVWPAPANGFETTFGGA